MAHVPGGPRRRQAAPQERPARQHVELAITGMTCASCAVRTERRLNKLGGVTASVNLASEHAAVAFDPAWVGVQDLVGAVKAAGYGAALPEVVTEDDPARPYRFRLLVALVLSIPLAIFAWVATVRPPGWEWLATPTALMVGTGRGAQLGPVIKGPEVPERTRPVTTIFLDKTGTLTEGKMAVSLRLRRFRAGEARG